MSNGLTTSRFGFFPKLRIGERFVAEFSDGVARCNYGQGSEMNAWVTLVSLAGGGLAGGSLFSVKEGNQRICEGLLQNSGAKVYTNADVGVITPRNSIDGPSEGYTVMMRNGSEQVYDAVIIAAPLEFADIDFKHLSLHEMTYHKRAFQVTHVTFVIGRLNPEYFRMNRAERIPDLIMTRNQPDIPFSAIGRWIGCIWTAVKPSVTSGKLIRYSLR